MPPTNNRCSRCSEPMGLEVIQRGAHWVCVTCYVDEINAQNTPKATTKRALPKRSTPR